MEELRPLVEQQLHTELTQPVLSALHKELCEDPQVRAQAVSSLRGDSAIQQLATDALRADPTLRASIAAALRQDPALRNEALTAMRADSSLRDEAMRALLADATLRREAVQRLMLTGDSGIRREALQQLMHDEGVRFEAVEELKREPAIMREVCLNITADRNCLRIRQTLYSPSNTGPSKLVEAHEPRLVICAFHRSSRFTGRGPPSARRYLALQCHSATLTRPHFARRSVP